MSKSFGANLVLRDVSIAVPRGSARALVGRNGAGKSTLVGVLTGLLAPDQGSVAFEGQPALRTRTHPDGRRQVACVYQKSTLVPTISVAENLFINRHPGSRSWVDWSRTRQQAQRVLDEWELGIDADTVTERLRVEQRQLVEIARALLQGARFIILDEPTAALESKEIDRLFQRIGQLKADGVTLLYISHHLQEIYDVCDSVTVMRDGQVVADAPLSAMPKPAVVAAMVGDEVAPSAGARAAAPSAADGPAMLEVAGLGRGRGVRGRRPTDPGRRMRRARRPRQFGQGGGRRGHRGAATAGLWHRVGRRPSHRIRRRRGRAAAGRELRAA